MDWGKKSFLIPERFESVGIVFICLGSLDEVDFAFHGNSRGEGEQPKDSKRSWIGERNPS